MSEPNEKTTLKDPTRQVLAAGFWLPCGRTSFVDTREDRPLIAELLIEHYGKGMPLDELSCLQVELDPNSDNPGGSQLECSVLNRVCRVFQERRFDQIRLVKPEYITAEMAPTDDPEGMYAYAKEIVYEPFGDSQVQKKYRDIDSTEAYPKLVLRNVNFIIDHNGFYICWVTGEQAEGVNEENLERFLIDLLQGWDTLLPDASEDKKKHEADFPYTVYVEKRYNGILSFAQLDMVMEGLNNYCFNTDVFFELKEGDGANLKDYLWKHYGLYRFFDSIVTPLTLHPTQAQAVVEAVHPGLNDLLPRSKEHCNIIQEILRQFLLGTASNIQLLKWTVERCRRQLLNEMISEAHRRNALLQIKTRNEERKQPNSAVLKGYVMFIGAKMPILQNVQRHLSAIQQEGAAYQKDSDDDSELLRSSIQDATRKLSELLYSWNALVDGLAENIRSIDNAISQARQDRILHEQEQIRAEQEATAESARVSEHSGNGSIGMDEEASARGANLLAIISVVLAFGAFLISDDGQSGPREWFSNLSKWRQAVPDQILNGPVSVKIFFIFLAFCLFSLVCFILQYFLNMTLQVIARAWRRWFGKVVSYYYEIDARIEEHIDPNMRGVIFTGQPQQWTEERKRKSISTPAAEAMSKGVFELGRKTTGWWTKPISFVKWFLGAQTPVYFQSPDKFVLADLTRKYYRVERSRDDEALHKINFEANLVLSKPQRQTARKNKIWRKISIFLNRNRIWAKASTIVNADMIRGLISVFLIGNIVFRLLTGGLPNFWEWLLNDVLCLWVLWSLLKWGAAWDRECIPCHFTYEFLYHHNASENNKFVMRELRFVGHEFQRKLTLGETMKLKEAIIYTLVGTWVDNPDFTDIINNLKREPLTAFLAE